MALGRPQSSSGTCHVRKPLRTFHLDGTRVLRKPPLPAPPALVSDGQSSQNQKQTSISSQISFQPLLRRNTNNHDSPPAPTWLGHNLQSERRLLELFSVSKVGSTCAKCTDLEIVCYRTRDLQLWSVFSWVEWYAGKISM